MIPIFTLISRVLAANKAMDAAKDKASESDSEATAASEQVIELDTEEEEFDVEHNSTKEFEEVPEGELEKLFYLIRLLTRAEKEEKSDSEVVESNVDIEVEEIPTDIQYPEGYNVSVEEEESEDRSGKGFWIALAVLGFMGILKKLGIGKKLLGSNEILTISNYKELEKLLSELPDEYKTSVKFSEISSANIEYELVGNLFERMGVSEYRVTSQYGEYRGSEGKGYHHNAIDLATPMRTPVKAPFDGTIYYIAHNVDKAGNLVQLVNEEGTVGITLMHLDEIPVKIGQKVKAGELIAYTGNSDGGAKRKDGSSWSTGAHLHLEAREIKGRIKVGQSIKGKSIPFDPRTMFVKQNKDTEVMISDAEFDMVEELPGLPKVRMSFGTESNIGTRGKNLLSVKGKDAWLGRIGTNYNKAGGFAHFDSYAHGIRAGAINLLKYQTVHDVSESGGQYVTISEIANNRKRHNYVSVKNGDVVEDWVQNVSKGSGYRPDERIDLRDKDSLARVVQGIALAEHSVKLERESAVSVISHFNIVEDIASNKQ